MLVIALLNSDYCQGIQWNLLEFINAALYSNFLHRMDGLPENKIHGILESIRGFQWFYGIRGRPWTHGTHGVPWIPGNFIFPRSSMDLIEFHGTPWCLMDSTESMEFHGFDRIPSTPEISIVCLGFHGSSWIQKNITDSTEVHEIHTIPMVPWSFLEVHGAPLFLKSYMEFM